MTEKFIRQERLYRLTQYFPCLFCVPEGTVMKTLALNSNLGAFMKEVERYPLLSRKEEFSLAVKHWETGDTESARALVNSNLRFVVRIAKSYASYDVSLMDLIQEGALGLMTAVKKFNPRRGYRLVSYAVWWIKARIHEHIMRFWSIVRIGSSRNERKLFQKIPAARRALRTLNPRPKDCQKYWA